MTAQFDEGNRYIAHRSLQVNSQPLKDLLKDVIGFYPSYSFQSKNVSIPFPARPLLHLREEIEAAGKQRFKDNEESHGHLKILLEFIDSHFQDEFTDGKNLLEQNLISYKHLWTIFKPGITVYSSASGHARAYKLHSYEYVCGNCPALNLCVSYVDYDGEHFGTRQHSLQIPIYNGAEPITDLEAFPFKHHPRAAEIEAQLIDRGRKFESLAGQHFVNYVGIAVGGCNRYNINGRIMLDCKTFHRLNPKKALSVTPFKQEEPVPSTRQARTQVDQEESLKDEQTLVASATVRGFSFDEKEFMNFFVTNVSPIDWNPHCFQQLVLAPSQKDLVQALVAEHTKIQANGTTKTFDDIVKGKGKGLVLVLHGPPGVGKTLTAECVAEFARRPLYIVSSGDLGTHPEDLNSRLSRIMDMASTWKAVLLIDEADVFLERRSLHDLQRNALVSIFLRVLEYYQGILFLTTNRVRTFDEAFKSRIHVPLRYSALDRESRKKVWRNFLEKGDDGTMGVDIDEEGYDHLSEADLNGRCIKNVIRTAKSLASYRGIGLDVQQLEQVTRIQMEFSEQLEGKGVIDEVEN